MKAVKKTYRELSEIWEALTRWGKIKDSPKFSIRVARNKRIVRPFMDEIAECSEPSDDYIKYDQERVQMNKKMAKKDERGRPMMEGGQYVFEDYNKWESELDKLKEKYKGTIASWESQRKKVREIKNEKVEIKPIPIPIPMIPEKIDGNDLEVLLDFIEE